MASTNETRTRAVLEAVFEHRQVQEARYGEANKSLENGTGPETRWLLPFTNHSAQEIEVALRGDYEAYEEETGAPTWVHLVREEIAEAFQETDPAKLAEELIQVAALCVSWVERLPCVPLGSLWRGISGNILRVVEVRGAEVKLAYLNDPEDSVWEEASSVISSLELVPTRLGEA